MRNLLMLGLLLAGTAGAEKLYTITVKMAPVFDQSTFMIEPSNAKLKKQYTILKKGPVVTFKVPAGAYTLYVSEMDVKPERYGVATLKINVTKNQTFTVPTDPWPVMDARGEAVFGDLLIAMGAAFEACDDPLVTVSDLCAEFPHASWEIVRSYVKLNPDFVQVQAWNKFSARVYSSKFTIGQNRYDLIVLEDNDGAYLHFSRVK